MSESSSLAERDAEISSGEFVALAALMLSLVAMSVDSMLPALGIMGRELEVGNPNDVQLVVSCIFFGLAIAQMFFGPLSDAWGRKPAIYLGLGIFIAGSALCVVSTSFEMMLVGRVLQGVGAAGPKIVTIAVVRDRYVGAGMARIMSIVLAVFVIVPALAPLIGQGILELGSWRTIFAFLLVQGIAALLWFSLRQEESLPAEERLPLSARRIASAIRETFTTRVALGFTLAAGLIFGGFLGYLNSAQQIFQVQYGVGGWFPAYFGGLSLALGCASVFNARMVLALGMFSLSLRSVWFLAGLSALASAGFYLLEGDPPLWLFMGYLVPAFFCIGILFGNFNAMAMEPLGHIAGTAAAVIASVSTFLSLGCGLAIGRSFNGTVLPLVFGLAILTTLALPILYWVRNDASSRGEESD